MAIVYAVKTGNWSDTTVWNTGALPTSADDVYSNNFTVTVNQNINVISLRNGATIGVNAGGQFTGNAGITVVCDTIVNGAGQGTLRFLAISGTCVVTANTIIGGSFAALELINSIALNITINGNILGSPSANAVGLTFNGGTVPSCVINGNITAQIGAAVSGGTSTSQVTINGVATSSATNNAITNFQNSATNIFSITKAATPDNGLAAINNTASKLASVTVKEIEQGVFGFVPIQGYVRLSTASGAFYKGITPAGAVRTLSDPADIAGQVPAQSDVRFGVSYQGGSKTGSAYIPAAASVGFGVPVDNTTGTAALTPASVWDAATSSLTTSGSIGERLKNASTVDTTGDQLAALL
jgi:hypothetical protein